MFLLQEIIEAQKGFLKYQEMRNILKSRQSNRGEALSQKEKEKVESRAESRVKSRAESRVESRMESRVESRVESGVSLHLKQDEKSVPQESCAVTPPGPGTEGRRSKMKQRLALHCEKVGQKKKLKATNKARLKDKLQIIKQKMAEDENVWSSLQSTKNK